MVDYREILVKGHQSASESFDKAIMSLSGGALAISIAFVHNVAPKPTDRSLLTTAWFLFAASLLLTLISFIASQAAILEQVKRLDGKATSRKWGWWLGAGTVTTALNLGSAGAFVAGVVSSYSLRNTTSEP